MSQSTSIIERDEIEENDKSVSLNNDELVSDEISDIITEKPGWVIRHGVTLIGAVILLLLLFSWFVRYPDVIKAPMSIVAVNAPKKVLARSEGKLQSLLVTNGDLVEANQPLAYLQSTGNHSDVFAIQKWIMHVEEAISNNNIDVLSSIKLPKHTSLGELQQPFYEFQANYHEVLQTLSHGFYVQELSALEKDMEFIEEQNKILLKQKQLAIDDYDIQEKEFKAKEYLAREKVIAPLEFGHDKSTIINKSASLQQMEAQLLGQKVAYHNKKKEIMEIKKQIEDLQNRFFSSLSVLKNKIGEWISHYVILSPEAGKLQFETTLLENQYINNAQELFYVEPENSMFYGEIVANQAGIGKVTIGQSVIVRLESYPSNEFGYLQGKVTYVSSLLVRDSRFLIHVSLSNGMRTNYDKTIPFKSSMKAQAEIITQDRRLLEKLFSNIIDKVRR
jgi:HlyD family secretion protein